MDYVLRFSTYLGLFIVLFFGVCDFAHKVRKTQSLWRYYLAMIVFLLVNVTVYLMLTMFVLKQSPTAVLFPSLENNSESVSDQKNNSNSVNGILPLIIAVVYSGAGAGSFRFGNKEFEIQRILLTKLQGMFKTPGSIPADLEYRTSKSKSLYERLRNKADGIQIGAKANQWDVLQDKWNEYLTDEGMLNKQISYLENLNDKVEVVKGRLDIDSSTFREISAVINNIRERIDTIRTTLNTKLQEYLVAFGFANYMDYKLLTKFLASIEVIPKGPDDGPKSDIMTRSLVMGFMFGLLFGPIFAVMKEGVQDALLYSWIGAFCVMVFTGFISRAIATNNFITSAILGAVGGYLAHLSWDLLVNARVYFPITEAGHTTWDPAAWMRPGRGLAYGIMTSMLLLAFKHKLPPKFKGYCRGCIIVALTGFVLYPCLYILFDIDNPEPRVALLAGCVGIVVMAAMALATDVVKPQHV